MSLRLIHHIPKPTMSKPEKADKTSGIVPFEDVDGKPRFRVVGGNGEVQASSEDYTRPRDRDRGIDALRRTVIADSLQIINPKDGDVIILRHKAVDRMKDVPFLQGWAASLQVYLKEKRGVTVQILILPDYLDVDCLTPNDMLKFGWVPAPANDPPTK